MANKKKRKQKQYVIKLTKRATVRGQVYKTGQEVIFKSRYQAKAFEAQGLGTYEYREVEVNAPGKGPEGKTEAEWREMSIADLTKALEVAGGYKINGKITRKDPLIERLAVLGLVKEDKEAQSEEEAAEA